jgi:coenzyme F420-reducing hydrogenase beta subunit
MYDKLLQINQNNRNDIIYLIGLHCTKSKKFQNQILT